MAGIDKTYTDSWKEYSEFVEWARGKQILFLNKYKISISEYIYDLEEEDFTQERPIMNTPTWLDTYLIQNCPCEFVQNRMKQVYGKSYDKLLNCKFPTEINPEYKQNRKIVIRRTNRTKFPIHNKVFGGKWKWWIQCDSSWNYNEEWNLWANRDSLIPTYSNTMHSKTLKSAIRNLRKQYLPAGLKFLLSGRYIGEEYELITK